MDSSIQTRKKIIVFIILTTIISATNYYIMFTIGNSRDVGVFFMWSPGLAAIITQWIFKDSLRTFGWKPGNRKFILQGFMAPILYGLIIYGFTWLTGLAGFRPPGWSLVLALPVGFVAAWFAALGEEIGWRGLLIPELVKITSFSKAVLISWILWAFWHFPAMLFTDYHSLAPRWFFLTTFSLAVLGMSAFTAWWRLKSGSLWPVVLWHGNHNLFIQGVFLYMTVENDISEFILDDFGLGVMLSALLLGFIFWRKRHELKAIGAL